MRIRIRGSAPLTNDPDPDPTPLLRDFKDAKKIFSHILSCNLTPRHIIFILKNIFFCKNFVLKPGFVAGSGSVPLTSVADPYVLGPPGSESISKRYPDPGPSIIKQK
jgi:hypothetical protein